MICFLLFIVLGFILVLQGAYKEYGLLGIIGFGLIWIVVSPEEDRLAVIGYTVVLSGLASLIALVIRPDKNNEN